MVALPVVTTVKFWTPMAFLLLLITLSTKNISHIYCEMKKN